MVSLSYRDRVHMRQARSMSYLYPVRMRHRCDTDATGLVELTLRSEPSAATIEVMTVRPEVPQFGALLRPHIASVAEEGRPVYLAGLERSAAVRVPEKRSRLTCRPTSPALSSSPQGPWST